MKNQIKIFINFILIILLASCNSTPQLGVFEGNNDIGNVNLKGTVKYNPEENAYAVSGSGTNMWFDNDELHFVWKKMSGDVSIAADIDWIGEGVDPHRKACLIIRQSLEPGSAYADAAVHGDGLTSIQYRESLR